ncbi:tetratricopeptide repeat protein [Sphingorhabdus sp.]|uniref:tetratricopeptide repeat protein n=1 Tax=Sphingorhabdus sp. TaxID=1902408 RepID=UPI00391C4423
MRSSVTKCTLAGCATFMVAGCATQQNIAPQYRLSEPSANVVEGSSMLQRGRAQLDAGLDALAIESFRAEIRFNPGSVDAYNGLGVAYGRIGRNDLAQRYFEIALAQDPLNSKIQSNLAKLPGNAELQNRQATALPSAMHDPVAVTADSSDALNDSLVVDRHLPALAEVQLAPQPRSETPPVEILDKRGVLSARFAVAYAAATVQSATRPVLQSVAQPKPVRPPVLPMERRSPYLQSEIRLGARLERVSLNEVRLITHAIDNSPSRQAAHDFESFGERIALWLPEYMSAEQAASRYRGDERLVIMAAVERAIANKKVANVTDSLGPEAPRFAYIFFDGSDGVAGT